MVACGRYGIGLCWVPSFDSRNEPMAQYTTPSHFRWHEPFKLSRGDGQPLEPLQVCILLTYLYRVASRLQTIERILNLRSRKDHSLVLADRTRSGFGFLSVACGNLDN